MTAESELRERLFASRIVGYEQIDPYHLRPNPLNWRVHGRRQRQLLEESLRTFGWIESLLWNKRTGHLIDGHLRRELACDWQLSTVPCTVVDISEEDERLALTLFDAIGAMAFDDKGKLAELLVEAQRLGGNDDALTALASYYQALPQEHVPAEPSEANLTPTRQMQLLLDRPVWEGFMRQVETLIERYGTDNISDTIVRAIDEAGRAAEAEQAA